MYRKDKLPERKSVPERKSEQVTTRATTQAMKKKQKGRKVRIGKATTRLKDKAKKRLQRNQDKYKVQGQKQIKK